MTEKLRPLDCVSSTEPCEECGSDLWIIDAEKSDGPFWLLCMDVNHKNCVNTKPIPDHIEVVVE